MLQPAFGPVQVDGPLGAAAITALRPAAPIGSLISRPFRIMCASTNFVRTLFLGGVGPQIRLCLYTSVEPIMHNGIFIKYQSKTSRALIHGLRFPEILTGKKELHEKETDRTGFGPDPVYGADGPHFCGGRGNRRLPQLFIPR